MLGLVQDITKNRVAYSQDITYKEMNRVVFDNEEPSAYKMNSTFISNLWA